MKMKSILLTWLACLSLLVIFTPAVLAADCSSPDLSPADIAECAIQATDPDGQTQDNEARISNILEVVINILSIVIGIAAVITIIIQGFRLVVSGGNAETSKSARNGILYVVIGLFIVVSAQTIVFFILDKL